jgi:hypothetical protein
MNYKKIYDDLCEYCKNTNPKERLSKRNLNDVRLKMDKIYTEAHHIVPKHSGGADRKSNLVVMLPEEHLLAHLIRFKAYNEKMDFLAVRFIINGFKNKKKLKISNPDFFKNKSFLSQVALFKQLVFNFRKEFGWQTEDGRKRISEARKGTFPCKDSKTGEPVGSHNKNHPKILSGEWVHHSKGKTSVTNLETGKREYLEVGELNKNRDVYKTNSARNMNGNLNTNYKEMTIERRNRVFKVFKNSVIDGVFIKKTFETKLKLEFKKDFKKISIVWIKNNFGSVTKLVEAYNKENNTNIIYSKKGTFKIINKLKGTHD